jgi:DNA-binding NtrC family response regulator
VGGSSQIKVDIRIIAASHQNLHEMVKRKLFRDDLWFRLNVFPIIIPPLRDRKEDIPALVHHFIEKKSKDLQMPHLPKLVPGAMAPMMAYAWPGNVRELENVIERALILSKGRPLTFDNIVWPDDSKEQEELPTRKDDFSNLDHIVSRHIKHALEMTKGRIHGPAGAAHLLGLNPSTLRHRMRKLGILHGRGKH